MDSLTIKQVLPFEHGLHQHLKSNHAALLATLEKNGAKWKTKSSSSDSPEKQEFAKSCQAAEAELREAIAAFKKSFA
jgi:F-type H+-transporting ATPase subunit alpha